MLEKLLQIYFVDTGVGWAVLGAMAAVMQGCFGSALGIRIACSQAAGVLSEKPELFGKLLVLMALPGTQGFYSFICMVFIALRIGLTVSPEAALKVSPMVGIALFFVGLCAGVVEGWSAKYQGQTAAAAINLVAKKPDESGRAILLPALVETYAVVALLTALLLIFWLTKPVTG